MSDSETAQSTTDAVASSQTMLGQSESAAADAAVAQAKAGQPQENAAEASGPDGAETQAAVSYADFTLPEGIELDPQSLTEAKQLFAADGLSQERAQSYVDLYAGKLKFDPVTSFAPVSLVGVAPIMILVSNDMPVKNYDFQAPLGQYGQIREQFYALRPLHLFLHNFGDQLAGMDTALPDVRPNGKNDDTTLRWAVRANGQGGFLFVNNHERGRTLSAKEGVQFTIKFREAGSITLPSAPITVPADAHFLWPVNFSLGSGGHLVWATAQPLAVTGEGANATWYFAETPGIPAEFVFTNARVVAHRGKVEVRGDGYTRALDVTPGNEPALILNSSIKVVLLSLAEAQRLYLQESKPAASIAVAFEPLRPAGPLRKIELGKSPKPVAAAPGDADFANAAVWKIKLPPDALNGDQLLRLHYVGDVARIYIDGKFITDDYYNGEPLEIGLRRYAAALKNGELTIAILPLQKDAPIYLPDSAKPDFKGADSIVGLNHVDMIANTIVQSASR